VPEKKLAARGNLLKIQQLRYARGGKKEEHEKLGLELVDLLAACGDDRAEAKQPAEAVAMYRQALTMATTWKSGRTGEIMDKIKQLSAALEAEKRIAVLKARLEKDPKDATARTGLIMAYLGEMDSPAEAVKLLTADVDEGLRTYIPLAAKKVEELEEAACLQLAEWLVSVADKATPADKGVLLGRAKACCERYLELHTAQDAGRLKGKILLDKVAKAIEGNSDKNSMWKLLRKALADQKVKRWPLIGGGFSQTTFEEVPPGGALLIGFRYTTIGGGNYPGVVQPIFLTGAGELYGKTYGVAERGAALQTVKAKAGYAVGAIFVRGGGGFDAFKPIFMRVKDKGLDTKDSYEGPHIGGQGGGNGTVGGDGNFIVGLHGKLGANDKMETMSAVSLATEAAPASGDPVPAPKKLPRKPN
jgi:hypothetical protein